MWGLLLLVFSSFLPGLIVTEYYNLGDLLDSNLVEFSLWDPEKRERSSSGILKMRHLTTNYKYVHENQWQYVCGSRSDIDSLANVGQSTTCETMNFNTTVSFSMSKQELEGDEQVPGYTITCEGEYESEADGEYESEYENCLNLITYQKYCYNDWEGEEQESGNPNYGFYQVSCSCNEGYQKTAYGCSKNEGYIFGLEEYDFTTWKVAGVSGPDGVVMAKEKGKETWSFLVDYTSIDYNDKYSELDEEVAVFLCKTQGYNKMTGFGRVGELEWYSNVYNEILNSEQFLNSEQVVTLTFCEYQQSTSSGNCHAEPEPRWKYWSGEGGHEEEQEEALKNAAMYLSCSCNEGSYMSTTKGKCELCPENSVLNAHQCECSAGKFWKSELCYECPVNSYSSQGATQCVPCPEGSNSSPGSSHCLCEAGSYFQEELCALCPENSYSYYGSTECELCPSGSGSASDRSFCSCPAGQFWGLTERACLPCSENTFSSGNSKVCKLCPLRSTSPSGSATCACSAGYYLTQDEEYGPLCQICLENHFSRAGSTACSACPVSKVSRPGAEACIRCELGQFWENHTCHSCPEDLHGDGIHCYRCPKGYGVSEGFCFLAVHKMEVAIIGLTGLAFLLSTALICTIVTRRRKVPRKTTGEGGQLDNIEMKQVETKDDVKTAENKDT